MLWHRAFYLLLLCGPSATNVEGIRKHLLFLLSLACMLVPSVSTDYTLTKCTALNLLPASY